MRKRHWFYLFMIVSLLISPLVFGMPGVKQWRLTWDANTETDLAGYKVYWSLTSGDFSDTESHDVGMITECPLNALPLTSGKTYYFVVTAYDTSANESGFSNEVSHPLDLVSPGAPAGLKKEEIPGS